MKLQELQAKLTHIKPLDFILLILIVAALYFGIVKISREKQVYYLDLVPQHNSHNDEPYTPTHWSIDTIKPGASSYDAAGNKIAEVVSINSVDAGHLRKRVKLKLKVFGILDRRTNQFRLNDTEIKVGGLFNLTLNNTNFNGIITHIGPNPDPPTYTKKVAHLKMVVQQVPNWHAATINSDFVVTNNDSQILFKIEKVEAKPAEKTGYTDSGQITTATDPLFKDLYLEVTAQVDCYQESCFFLDIYPLKISQPWYLYSTNNQLNEAKVTEILSIETPKQN